MAVSLLPGCGTGIYFFGAPLNEEAVLELRAARSLGCTRGATIAVEHEADDGIAFTICCDRPRRRRDLEQRCGGYFCPYGRVCHAY
ncbi:MAG: hypothetical protein KC657_26440 [Myxococcales bacterium]|nr:hypothetical protein [Myxococcales bacterium]